MRVYQPLRNSLTGWDQVRGTRSSSCIRAKASVAGPALGECNEVATDAHPAPAVIAILPAIWLMLVAFAVWFLYRIVKGLVRALDGKAYN